MLNEPSPLLTQVEAQHGRLLDRQNELVARVRKHRACQRMRQAAEVAGVLARLEQELAACEDSLADLAASAADPNLN